MSRNDIYKTPHLQSGYDAADEPIVRPADPAEKRRPLEPQTADLSDPDAEAAVPDKQSGENDPQNKS